MYLEPRLRGWEMRWQRLLLDSLGVKRGNELKGFADCKETALARRRKQACRSYLPRMIGNRDTFHC